MNIGLNQRGMRWVKLLFIMLIVPLTGVAKEFLIAFNVTVVAPTCVVNDNKPIDVDFGSDVNISRIGSADYKLLPVTFSLKCETNNTYNLVVQGVAANFEPGVLATDTPDLGVEFMINNKRQPINRALSFNYPSLPLIYARPVISNVNRPLAGGFSAAASLKVSYD